MNTSLNTEVKGNVPSPQQGQSNVAMLPAVDIIEDAQGITLKADVPGVSRENLNVRVEGGHLLIDAGISVEVPENLNVLYAEVRGGSYRRSFALSNELNSGAVEANLKDGVLTIRVPRTERAKARKIAIQA